MSGFIEYSDALCFDLCLTESPKVSANLAMPREWWAQWWAHLGLANSSEGT